MEPMWKYEVAEGVVEKITPDYVVVKWFGINGQWHFTNEQAERLEVIDEF
jgi:ribosomal protein S1